MQPGVGNQQFHGIPGTPVGDLFPLGNALLGDGNRSSLRPIRAGELRSHSALLHYLCCLGCSSLFSTASLKGHSKHVSSVVAAASLAVAPLAEYPPSPSTRTTRVSRPRGPKSVRNSLKTQNRLLLGPALPAIVCMRLFRTLFAPSGPEGSGSLSQQKAPGASLGHSLKSPGPQGPGDFCKRQAASQGKNALLS